MRTPRPQDFDTKHKSKTKRDKIDLSDAPQIKKPTSTVSTSAQKSVRKSERKSERTDNRTAIDNSDIPAHRKSRRHSFEIYDDQLTKMKNLKYQAELKGIKLFLSDIARKALDEYLADK